MFNWTKNVLKSFVANVVALVLVAMGFEGIKAATAAYNTFIDGFTGTTLESFYQDFLASKVSAFAGTVGLKIGNYVEADSLYYIEADSGTFEKDGIYIVSMSDAGGALTRNANGKFDVRLRYADVADTIVNVEIDENDTIEFHVTAEVGTNHFVLKRENTQNGALSQQDVDDTVADAIAAYDAQVAANA